MSLWDDTYKSEGIRTRHAEIDVFTFARDDLHPGQITHGCKLTVRVIAEGADASVSIDLTQDHIEVMAAALSRAAERLRKLDAQVKTIKSASEQLAQTKAN